MLAKGLFRAMVFVAGICSVAWSQDLDQQFESRSPHLYISKRSFFESSGFGALALMPNVVSRKGAAFEHQYITLSRSGMYRLARRRLKSRAIWWFIVNHRRGAGPSPHYTYIGVFIAKKFARPIDKPLHLYRNEGWQENDKAPHPFELSRDPELLGPFFELQREGSLQSLGMFQGKFAYWHATPDAQKDESSWAFRTSWLSKPRAEECFGAVGHQGPADSALYQGRLIRFRETELLNSLYPVVWDVDLGDADAFYMKTFSPTAGLSREYCVDIRD